MKTITACVVLVASLVAPGNGMGMPKKMEEMMDYYNLYASCFGQEAMAEYMLAIQQATKSCMSVSAPLELLEAVQQLNEIEMSDVEELLKNNPSLAQLITGRKKRQVDTGLTDAEMTKLTDNIATQKEHMLTKISNLTCVLAQMEILTPTADINIEAFSFENMKEQLKGYGGAGDDEDFVLALTNSYSDCYDISESWPQKNLDRHPLMQAFGRQHIFLNCMHKMEEKLCYKYQAYMGLKIFHGLDTAVNNLELPGDKFEAATAALMVMCENETDEEKFINKFFWSRSDM